MPHYAWHWAIALCQADRRGLRSREHSAAAALNAQRAAPKG
jgi:hypothetical protein